MARRRRSGKNPASSLAEAGAIMALSPWIFGARMFSMMRATPVDAALALQRHAAEKMLIGGMSAMESALEAGRQTASLAAAVWKGDHASVAAAGEKIVSAGLKPIAKRVRSNARSPNRKRKGMA